MKLKLNKSQKKDIGIVIFNSCSQE